MSTSCFGSFWCTVDEGHFSLAFVACWKMPIPFGRWHFSPKEALSSNTWFWCVKSSLQPKSRTGLVWMDIPSLQTSGVVLCCFVLLSSKLVDFPHQLLLKKGVVLESQWLRDFWWLCTGALGTVRTGHLHRWRYLTWTVYRAHWRRKQTQCRFLNGFTLCSPSLKRTSFVSFRRIHNNFLAIVDHWRANVLCLPSCVDFVPLFSSSCSAHCLLHNSPRFMRFVRVVWTYMCLLVFLDFRVRILLV